MKAERRQIVLGLALAATLLAVLWVETPASLVGEEVAAPTRIARHEIGQGDTKSSAVQGAAFGEVQRKDLPASDSDPFRTQSWYVAPPPPPPEPPPKPTAPPLPFQYMGMFEDQGKAIVYLVRGNESFSVSAGERFADSYQLEKIERGVLFINYLPLSIRQTLPIGNSE